MRDDYFVRNAPWCLYAAASCALATTAILRAEKRPSLLSFLSFFLFSSFLLSFNGILVSGGVNYAFNDSNSRKVDLFFSLFSSCLHFLMERGMESYFVKWFMHLTSKDFFSRFLLFRWRNSMKFYEIFFQDCCLLFEFYLQVPGLFRKLRNVKYIVIWLYLYLKFEYFVILREV